MTANTATEDATQCRHIEPEAMDGGTVTKYEECTNPAVGEFDIEAGYGADASEVPLCEEHRPDDDAPRGDIEPRFPGGVPTDPSEVEFDDYPTVGDYLDAREAARQND